MDSQAQAAGGGLNYWLAEPIHYPDRGNPDRRRYTVKLHRIIIAIAAGAAIAAPAAQADPSDNAIQPSPVYFGKVTAGTHPTRTLTLKNVTGHKQVLRRFDL